MLYIVTAYAPWTAHKTAPHTNRIGFTSPTGCAAFGLSHGLAGPLALLALAWQTGVRVPAKMKPPMP